MKLKLLSLVFILVYSYIFSMGNNSESISYKLTFIKLSKRKYRNIEAKLEFSEEEKDSNLYYDEALLSFVYKNIDFYVDVEETDQRSKLIYPFIFTGKIGKKIEYRQILENKSYDTEEYIKIDIKGIRVDSANGVTTELSFQTDDEVSEFSSIQTITLTNEYTPVAAIKARFDDDADLESYYLLLAKYEKRNLDISKQSLVFEDDFEEFEFMQIDKKYERDDNLVLYHTEDGKFDTSIEYSFSKFRLEGELKENEIKFSSNRMEYFDYSLRYNFEDEILAVGLTDGLEFEKLCLSADIFTWSEDNFEKNLKFDFIFGIGYKMRLVDIFYYREFSVIDKNRFYMEFLPEKSYTLNLKYEKSSKLDEISLGIKIKIE